MPKHNVRYVETHVFEEEIWGLDEEDVSAKFIDKLQNGELIPAEQIMEAYTITDPSKEVDGSWKTTSDKDSKEEESKV